MNDILNIDDINNFATNATGGASLLPSVIDPKIADEYSKRVTELISYVSCAENPHDLYDESRRLKMFAQLSYGLRKSGECLSWLYPMERIAKADTKRVIAEAALDRFVEYISAKKTEGKEIKVTEAVREHYINIDDGVRKAIEREATIGGMIEQVATIKMEFNHAIRTIAAIVYGTKDSDRMSYASTSVNDKE